MWCYSLIDLSNLSTNGFPVVIDLSHCLYPLHYLILFPCQVRKIKVKQWYIDSSVILTLCSVWFNSGRLGLTMGFIFYYMTFAPFHVVQALGYENLGL